MPRTWWSRDADGLAEGLLAVLADGPEVEATIARGRPGRAGSPGRPSASAHAALWRRYAG